MIATLTSKGQLTIPKAVREKLSLHTGSHVSFVVIDCSCEDEAALSVFTFDPDRLHVFT